jgi:3-oxoacyl-[acyl-carrier protein] reductase
MIKFDLNNRVAIVTGGAQGFGLAITERFIESGAKVIIWDIDESEAKKALEKVNSKNLTSQIVDVTNFESISENLKKISEQFGKIDIFINNAGISGINTTLEKYPLDEWSRIHELNLNAVFYCCKAVVPYMKKNKYGRIVNISSIAGKEGNPNACAYSSSKAAVIGLTKSLGKELALENIAVNCVTPAVARTKIIEQQTKEFTDYILSKIPRNRMAEVTELASMVTWLSSEENSFSTAAVFDLSGGRATY